MTTPPQEEVIIGTFADTRAAESAADAAQKAGFHVERRSGGAVAVRTNERHYAADEIRAILAAYGAREYRRGTVQGDQATGEEQQVRTAEGGATVELMEERLTTRTRPVETGEVTIRKEVVTETRTIEVPVRREEVVIEHHPIDRRPVDASAEQASDPLIQQLLDRLRHMQSGETLRIPIIEEEVVVHKRPVVVEEISVGKRIQQDTQKVEETVRREEARIDEHGDVRVHRQET